MTSIRHPTPGPKIPKQPSTAKPVQGREEKIDRQVEDSFPASDPPSFSGGNHVIGAPKERESESPKGDAHEVKSAEERVKKGNATNPGSY